MPAATGQSRMEDRTRLPLPFRGRRSIRNRATSDRIGISSKRFFRVELSGLGRALHMATKRDQSGSGLFGHKLNDIFATLLRGRTENNEG